MSRPQAARRRYRLRRGLLVALAIAVLVAVIAVARHTLAQSLHVLAELNPAWFVLAVAAEAVSLASFGLSRWRLVRVNGARTGFGSVMMITYAANALSISVPFAGAELALVYSYRQFRRHGADAATTGWTLAVSAICSTSALAFLLAVGALTGSASLASAAGLAGAVVYIVPGVAVLKWVADCAALACAIRAMGLPVPWDNLLLVYGAGAAVGSTGITPGGFALVELALTAALTATGLHRSPALAAVLAYRLVNFWLVLAAGWILMAVLARREVSPAVAS
ncbi:MAG: lysylphosphatidylglycerol synthase domain-containing protein [Streptosporangiaceae bacterium]